MKLSQLKQLIKESIDEDPLYVEYVGDLPDEVPFFIQGKKFEYVNARYPNGKVDIGVYSFSGDIVYSYEAFRNMFNIKENKMKTSDLKNLIKECIRESFADSMEDPEFRKWQSGINKHNRQNPQRYPCPTCKRPDALSAWQKKQGYQCDRCADREEGVWEGTEMGSNTGEIPNFDVSKLEDVEVDGIDKRDFPDFADAYVSSALYDGRELTEDELEWLNVSHPEVAHEKAHEHMQGTAGDQYGDIDENNINKLKKYIKECVCGEI